MLCLIRQSYNFSTLEFLSKKKKVFEKALKNTKWMQWMLYLYMEA